jgi:hypothetical protein
VPDSKTTRLAQLRAHATGESHQTAHMAIASAASAADPVIPEPTPQQEQLEGAIFSKLAELRWGPSAACGSGGFGIKRIIPAPSQLVMVLDPGSDIGVFALNVMPVIRRLTDEPDPDMHGIPGLRARPHALGVSLFRPGLEAEVVVAGITADQWEAAHAASFTAPHELVGCAALSNPAGWTKTEEGYDSWRRESFGDRVLPREADHHVLESAMFRRIGFLNRLAPTGANTWRSITGDGVVLEVFQDNEASVHERFMAAMASPRLSPPMTLVGLSSSRDQRNLTARFTTPRSGSVLEIRIVHHARRAA